MNELLGPRQLNRLGGPPTLQVKKFDVPTQRLLSRELGKRLQESGGQFSVIRVGSPQIWLQNLAKPLD